MLYFFRLVDIILLFYRMWRHIKRHIRVRKDTGISKPVPKQSKLPMENWYRTIFPYSTNRCYFWSSTKKHIKSMQGLCWSAERTKLIISTPGWILWPKYIPFIYVSIPSTITAFCIWQCHWPKAKQWVVYRSKR